MSQINHLAIIMDGNGRWAESRNQSRSRGHIAGAKAAHRMIEHAVQCEIPVLSLFAFSTENWKRPQREVETLMMLLRTYLRHAEPLFHKNRVRFDFVGDLEPLQKATQQTLERLRERTSTYKKTTLVLAVNYSGQQDIAQAARKTQTLGEMITPEAIEKNLQTSKYGPVDLLIRTGSETRLSNYYLWQSAYAQIHFSKTLWPDFTPADLDSEIARFRASDRRFGGLSKTS